MMARFSSDDVRTAASGIPNRPPLPSVVRPLHVDPIPWLPMSVALAAFLLLALVVPPTLAKPLPIAAVIIPVVFGWRRGLRASLTASLLLIPINVVSNLRALGSDAFAGASWSFAVGTAATIGIALAVGRLRDLRVALAREQEMARTTQQALARTQQLEAEARVQLAYEKTAKLAALGTAAAGVAHELNNPLAYIVTNLEFIEASLPRGTSNEVVAAVVEAREGAERMARIVRDLRVFSHGGPDDAPTEAVDLRLVARAGLNIARGQLEGITPVVDLGWVPPVKAHEGRLVQVAVNLLVNAAQAAREAGRRPCRVELRTYTVEDSCFPTKDRAVLEVSDNGVGIAPEVRERLFEPFFTTKKVGSGTGLGLAVVNGIVTETGGAIAVESELGKGSTFRVSLPTTKALDASSPLAPVPATSHERRILVVDDDRGVTRALRRLLRNERVETAGSVEEAMRTIAADPRFDAILSDLTMPDASGIDFYERLRNDFPSLSRRFVLITGSLMDGESRTWLESQDVPLLPKPFAAHQLDAILVQLDGRRDSSAKSFRAS